jgi:hypothetical protein
LGLLAVTENVLVPMVSGSPPLAVMGCSLQVSPPSVERATQMSCAPAGPSA